MSTETPQTSSDVLKARSAVGVAARRGNAEELVRARRELASAKIEQYIERVLAEAPPLSPAQRVRLAGLLVPGAEA